MSENRHEITIRRSGIFLLLLFAACVSTNHWTGNAAGKNANSDQTFGTANSLPSENSYLDGKLIAPPGTSVVLELNGTDDLTVVAASGKTLFVETPFKFPKLYPYATPYKMSIKSAPADQTCSIDQGKSGSIGLSPGFARVGCDLSFDLISRSTDNGKFGTFYESSAPVVGGGFSEEGRYVAFVSSAAGLDGASGKKRQIIWRDRNSGETRLVSTGMNGVEGNGDSFAPSISEDGKSVAFESYATNLVPIDTNGVRDIFVWNAAANTVTAVSTGPGEIETNAESFEPVISGDGSLVAFSSSANNLAPGVSDISTVNVYLKRVASGLGPILISADPKTKKGVGGSSPSIARNGSRIAIYSFASTLVPDDKNNLGDIFLYDSQDPKLKRLSVPGPGAERDQGTESASRVIAPSISGNGNFVAFATTATNMVPGDTNKVQDVFVVNVETGEVKRVSVGPNGEQGNGDSPVGQGEKIAVSMDGGYAAFSTNATNLGGGIILKNVNSGETRIISANSSVGRPAISTFGGYVVFGTGTRLDGATLPQGSSQDSPPSPAADFAIADLSLWCR